jgi:stage II sporulation protein D
MTLTDSGQKNHNLGKAAVLTRSGASAAIGKSKVSLPSRIASPGLFGFNGRKYRGELLVTREFVLINVLDVEDYIKGVLPVEASAKWPTEYLKVQAIISRTYGLRQSLNRSDRGYDVTDDTSAQVYKGAGVETSATDRAVRETEGEVLAYGEELAFTPFHSDSGGYTASNVHVWVEDIPYLRGAREPIAYRSPNSNWVAKISASQMQAALSKIGCSVGKVKEVRIAAVDAGGRATTLTFVGSGGSASAKSSLFRMAVGPTLLKSTMLTGEIPMTGKAFVEKPGFPEPGKSVRSPESSGKSDSLPKAPVPTSNTPMSMNEEARLIRMTSEGTFTSAELMDMLLNPNKRKGYLYMGIQRSAEGMNMPLPKGTSLPKSLPSVSMPVLRSGEVIREENGYFVFHGRGSGHGVGLSQWGAQALAKAGWTAERILEHYYPGTTVKRFK